jgi:hypothetical protein
MKGIQTRDSFVLTGAGFTKNFGGFLATEMWAQIFNDPLVQNSPKLRALLQDDFDYESVYSKVVENSHFSDADQAAMRASIQGAYKRLDDATRGWKFNSDSPYPVNIYGLGHLFNRIWPGPYENPSLFFTLNQDLFVERRWGHPSPGVPRPRQELKERELSETDFITLPTGDSESLIKDGLSKHNGIHYIKLHGSYGWRSSNGSNQLVIGTNKASLIKREPLLQGYMELFKSAIAEGNKKILIIGYGFRDPHINQVLVKGVEDNGLRIYILSTERPEDLITRIKNGHAHVKGEGHVYSKNILDGLSGYFPYTLKDVFPGNQDRTTYAQQIIEALRS